MTAFTLGTDCELFAKDAVGKFKALCGLVGGTKEAPRPFASDIPQMYAYQEDNVAVEFNIPPAFGRDEWVESVEYARNFVQTKINTELGLDIATNCAVSFDKSELSHPNALVFGCEPDYDAWKLVENKKPTSTNPNLRTAGGHVHVGCNIDMVKGVQNMDLFLGVPSIILDDSEGSVMRRELYGKAGAMRPKPYGWEYRTLSNFWVFDKELIRWVWNATSKAIGYKRTLTKKEGAIITNCINTGDVKTAKDLVSHYGLIMPS